MRLIELNKNRKDYLNQVRLGERAARTLGFMPVLAKIAQLAAEDSEAAIQARLAEGGIGWSEPLKFGISDAERAYEVRR